VLGGLAVVLAAIAIGVAGWHVTSMVRTGPDGLTAAARSEWAAARSDHDVIVAMSSRCTQDSGTFKHAIEIPVSMLVITPNGALPTGGSTPADPAPRPAGPKLDTPGYLLSAIILSNGIARSRIDVAGDEVRDSAWEQVFQWGLVIIGAITTVLISIKSMSTGRTPLYMGIGIAAIVFSALGTGVAAMNSFYSPRLLHDHDKRALAGLRQLHLQLATGLTREGNICTAFTDWKNDWRFQRIKALTDQYNAIINAVQSNDLGTEGDSGGGSNSSPAEKPPEPDAAQRSN